MAGGLAWARVAGLAGVDGRPAVEATQSCCSRLAPNGHWLTVPSTPDCTVTAMAWTNWRYCKPDISMSCNGMLAGLVAITAPCAFVAPWAASVIGIVAGLLVCYGVYFFDHVVHVDDPCGAISVHGVCGAWGVLAVGIFADGTYGSGWNGVSGNVKGLITEIVASDMFRLAAVTNAEAP